MLNLKASASLVVLTMLCVCGAQAGELKSAPTVSPKQSDSFQGLPNMRRLTSKELEDLFSDVELQPGSTIRMWFYKGGRFLIISEYPVYGTFRVENGRVCIYINNKIMECKTIYIDDGGNYYESTTIVKEKENKKYPIKIISSKKG